MHEATFVAVSGTHMQFGAKTRDTGTRCSRQRHSLVQEACPATHAFCQTRHDPAATTCASCRQRRRGSCQNYTAAYGGVRHVSQAQVPQCGPRPLLTCRWVPGRGMSTGAAASRAASGSCLGSWRQLETFACEVRRQSRLLTNPQGTKGASARRHRHRQVRQPARQPAAVQRQICYGPLGVPSPHGPAHVYSR